jgi:hypothetical protein
MSLQTNPQLELAANFIRYTDKHLFLTGKAGTGKTTFLRNLKNLTWKRHVVVAPTGVAAINAGGVTIHSFFQLPFGPQIPEELANRIPAESADAKHSASRFQRFTREKINIIKSIDLLVIDEISMVRADMLDAIDAVLRRYRNRNIPFGGIQLLMIGDLQQLAPIAKEDEWRLLRDYYDSVYFFSSKALQKTDYVSIELRTIYRQSDEEFIRLLGKVRENKLDAEALAALEKRYIPNFRPGTDEGYIALTTHNYQSQDINTYRLNELKGKTYTFNAEIEGEFSSFNYPTDEILKIKVGAQVMFVKNDPSPLKEFYNGKIGKITGIDDDIIYVKCPEDDTISVTPLDWQNCRYTLNEQTKEISETVIGSFRQYPLKLAWAVTIHKSQGLTFDKAIIDARQAFAHGQVYVALSRCRTLEGMVLSTSISSQALKTDLTVGDYVKKLEENAPDEKRLEAAKYAYQRSLIAEMFDFSLFHRRLGYLVKQISDNASSFDPGKAESISKLDQKLRAEVTQVAEKFMTQVNHYLTQNPDVEKNEELQDRIKKACAYFVPRFETIVIKAIPDAEADNKVLKKTVDDLLERFGNEAQVKYACLQLCMKGFTVAGYLEVRAKSSIEPPPRRKKASSSDLSATGVAHPDLLNRIRRWRDRLADEQDLTHYRVISRNAMLEIADKLPASRKELLEIKGLGKKKIKQYGTEILEIISEYLDENNIEKSIDDSPLLIKKKEKKPDSKLLSFELFNQGKSIADIANERGFAYSTIEGHLSHFVGTGEIPVEKLLEPQKLAKIKAYFSETEDLTLGPAKTVLGDDISWGELRFVIKHMEWENTGKNK